MITKEHFNSQGMTKLATLKNLINFGLSDSLKEAFPDFNISLIETISYNFSGIPHGMWVAGFVSGDGSFYTKFTQYKYTFHTGCVFKITLHLKDTALLEGLYYYLPPQPFGPRVGDSKGVRSGRTKILSKYFFQQI